MHHDHCLEKNNIIGYIFCSTDLRPNTATIASKIEPTTRAFDPAIEHAIANDVTAILQKPSKPISNLKPHLSKALQTLRQKKTTLKITKADKGNATVIMSQDQYNDKMMDYLSLDCYAPLNKDPTDSLTRKLDTILKNSSTRKKPTNPSTMPAAPPIPVDLNCMDSQKYTNLEILFVPSFLFIVHHCRLCINNYLLF